VQLNSERRPVHNVRRIDLLGEGLRAAQSRRRTQPLQESQKAPSMNARIMQRQLRAMLADWHALTTAEVSETRGLLETALQSRIIFSPLASGGFELTVPVAFDRLLVAAVPALERIYKKGLRPQVDVA
jgi:hypothetical protein